MQVFLIIHNLIYRQYKQKTNRQLRSRKTAARRGKHGRSISSEKNECLQVRFEGVQRRILSERKGKLGHYVCVCVGGGGGGGGILRVCMNSICRKYFKSSL